MKQSKVKKVSKKARAISEKLEGVLFIKKGMYTISLSAEEIYTLITDKKILIEDGDIKCHIE